MAVDNYIKVVGSNLHEIFLFDSRDPSAGQKAHEDAVDCAAAYDAKRPKTSEGFPVYPATLSVWMPFRHLAVIGSSKLSVRGGDDD